MQDPYHLCEQMFGRSSRTDVYWLLPVCQVFFERFSQIASFSQSRSISVIPTISTISAFFCRLGPSAENRPLFHFYLSVVSLILGTTKSLRSLEGLKFQQFQAVLKYYVVLDITRKKAEFQILSSQLPILAIVAHFPDALDPLFCILSAVANVLMISSSIDVPSIQEASGWLLQSFLLSLYLIPSTLATYADALAPIAAISFALVLA